MYFATCVMMENKMMNVLHSDRSITEDTGENLEEQEEDSDVKSIEGGYSYTAEDKDNKSESYPELTDILCYGGNICKMQKATYPRTLDQCTRLSVEG